MRFAFTQEQEMLRDMIRGALRRDAGLDKVRRWSDAGDPSAFDEFAAANGWAGIGIAEEAGGQGGGLVEAALLFEELGRSAAPSGALLAAAGVLGIAGRAEGALAQMPELAAGHRSAALAVSAGHATDLYTAKLGRDGERFTGQVPLVLGAPAAAQFVLPLREAQGLELWLVDARADGVRVSPRRMIDRTRLFGDLVFEGAPGRFLGRLDRSAAAEANASIAVLVAAESLGLARHMLEMTVAYVGQRVQFGVPVGSFQAVKHAAAEALVDIEAAHSGVYYAAWALHNREADGLLHAWIAKAFATEAAVRTADRMLMLHGAIGYTWEYDLQLFYKRAKLNLELFGSPRHYRERIADALPLY